MSINENVILTNGFDLQDAKAVLLSRGEVFTREDYQVIKNDTDKIYGAYIEILTLILLAKNGHDEAIEYLQHSIDTLFSECINESDKQAVINRVVSELNIKVIEDEN